MREIQWMTFDLSRTLRFSIQDLTIARHPYTLQTLLRNWDLLDPSTNHPLTPTPQLPRTGSSPFTSKTVGTNGASSSIVPIAPSCCGRKMGPESTFKEPSTANKRNNTEHLPALSTPQCGYGVCSGSIRPVCPRAGRLTCK